MNFIGGDNLSQNERQPYLERMRTKGILFKIPLYNNESWKLQCRCGNYTDYYSYRGKTYCRCGRRVDFLGHIEKMKSNTHMFSEGFIEHLEDFLKEGNEK